ncbi:MAG: hypothetical protein IH849_09325 [Acidobacteria bacterium]|nr:hypothetical protein [Acidobacteriota bacterium]
MIIEEIEVRAVDGYVSPLTRILTHSALGDMERLLPCLQEMLELGGGAAAIRTTNRPDLEKLRDDPVVGETIRKLPIWRATE